jgi:DNA polymerase-3 subunit chi
VDRVAALLLPKALAAGWRVSLRGTDANRLAMLDEKLWLVPEDGFLAHGLAGGPHDGHQPVLLSLQGDSGASNGATCIMSIDGAEVTPDEITAMNRVMILFDGGDGAALSFARAQWKTLTDAGCAARYWSEEEGGWAQKATKNVSGD